MGWWSAEELLPVQVHGLHHKSVRKSVPPSCTNTWQSLFAQESQNRSYKKSKECKMYWLQLNRDKIYVGIVKIDRRWSRESRYADRRQTTDGISLPPDIAVWFPDPAKTLSRLPEYIKYPHPVDSSVPCKFERYVFADDITVPCITEQGFFLFVSHPLRFLLWDGRGYFAVGNSQQNQNCHHYVQEKSIVPCR